MQYLFLSNSVPHLPTFTSPRRKLTNQPQFAGDHMITRDTGARVIRPMPRDFSCHFPPTFSHPLSSSHSNANANSWAVRAWFAFVPSYESVTQKIASQPTRKPKPRKENRYPAVGAEPRKLVRSWIVRGQLLEASFRFTHPCKACTRERLIGRNYFN
jgi:hypothetical protein